MTIAELIAQLRSQMAERLEQRNSNATRLAELRGGTNVDEVEVQRLRDANVGLDAELDQLQARATELEAEQARDEAAGRLQRELVPTGVQRRQGGATITSEPRTYTRERSRSGEARFFQDAWNAQRGNTAARDRIERHGQEVLREGEMTERALATGGVAGLVVPQYLIDLAAPVLRAGRPFANACNHHELPDQGMSLVVPRGTTGASAAAQASENSGVSNTDEVWANLTIPVCTVAGQEQVSRQTLERGEGMDEIIYLDLARAHAAQVDNYCWNGSGSSGQPLGALQTGGIGAATAFGAAPTITNTALKIAGAITNVTSAGAGIFAKFLFMHPRRWGWFTAQVDGSQRPVVMANQVGPFNAVGQITAPGKMGGDEDPVTGLTIVGFHSSGLPVVTDLNIPTNVGTNLEDIMAAIDTQEMHLWEDGDGMPRQLNFEQTLGNQLTTTLVVYSYIAFTAGRYPAAVSKIGGLDSTATFGLVAPSF